MKIPVEIKIPTFYLIIGLLWIAFSDKVLDLIIAEKEVLTEVQTYKGWFFVVFTAFVLYVFLRRYFMKLRKVEGKASENEKLKNAFIKNISHEIRTPINGIVGFSELLKDESLTFEEKTDYVSIIEKSTQDLLLAVNGMMDLSLLESGSMTIEDNSFSIKCMLHAVFLQYKNYEKPNVVLKKEYKIDANRDVLVSDEAKIKLVLGHLINNAFKFTTNGYVKIGCFQRGDFVVFYVDDTGAGMSRENQDVIFDSFSKVNPTTEEFKSGIGLGLTISKSVVSYLGGDIWLHSVEDEGSTFYFSIPIINKSSFKSNFAVSQN